MSTLMSRAGVRYVNLLAFPTAPEFRHEALGTVSEVTIAGLTGAIHLPRGDLSRLGEFFNNLSPPTYEGDQSALQLVERVREEDRERLYWGKYFTHGPSDPAGTAKATVSAALLVIQAEQGGEVFGLRAVAERVLCAMPEWSERLLRWIEVLTHQDLDSEQPLKPVWAPMGLATQAWITDGPQVDYDVASPPLNILGSRGDQALSLSVWRRALDLTGRECEPPEVHLLLRDARTALHRGQTRRCVIDLATTTELVVTDLLRATLAEELTPGEVDRYLDRHWMISGRIRDLSVRGAPLPEDLYSDVMEVRNRAVHQNASVSRRQADRAYETVRQFISTFAPL